MQGKLSIAAGWPSFPPTPESNWLEITNYPSETAAAAADPGEWRATEVCPPPQKKMICIKPHSS